MGSLGQDNSEWANYFSVIRHLGGMIVCVDRLSTDIGAGAAGVGLAGFGVVGCFARVTVTVGDGFSDSTDGLSRVAGVVDATAGVVVCSTLPGVEISTLQYLQWVRMLQHDNL